MSDLTFAALLLAADDAHVVNELFMPTKWFGIIMFIVLMLMLLVTVMFSSKGKQLPPREHEDH
ncbi:MAG: hypothetical protein Q4F53_01500 [Nesterenkonia sp.]|uniref:hypothetical protein n=1 Tax=Nesterenkonia marinintestina TaxID=2979865 RepID=UPI0021BEB0C4|nr:hypothetical protein [Nesterenkonia sp. GX14115]MDO5492272.1 hypothetical protein [Nesterenkonia sp.]